VPDTIAPVLAGGDTSIGVAAAGGGISIGVALAGAGAAVVGATARDAEATIPAVEPVPFCAMAICSNIAWVLLAVGLIENVMPLPQ
jgi:hypothetical protein